MYSIQHYVIKFVSDMRQVDGFLRFPPPIKLTARYNWIIVESGVKHHNPNQHKTIYACSSVRYDWFNLSKFIKSNLSLHIIYKTFCFRFCIIGSVWHAILFHFPCFIVQLPSVLRIYLCLLANKEMWFYLISFYNSRPAWMEDVWKFKYAINVNECMFGFIVPRDF